MNGAILKERAILIGINGFSCSGGDFEAVWSEFIELTKAAGADPSPRNGRRLPYPL